MWKKNLLNFFASVLNMKNRELHVLKYLQPLPNTLLMHLWQQLRRQGLFEDDATSRAHHYFSICVRLDGKRQCVAIFRSLRDQVWDLAGPLKDIH